MSYKSKFTGQQIDQGIDKANSAYQKPDTGIPETDMSTEVQASLGKAETALQDFTETDPTVPSWAKQPTKPAYTAEEVGALPDTTPIPVVPTNVSAFNNDAGYLTNEDMGGYATKQELNGKQDTINDLGSIRSGASAGATAYQKPQAGIPESDLSQGVKDKLNENEVFWATYRQTTAAEIDAAVAAGKMVCSTYSGQYCPLVHITNDYYSFISVNRSNAILRLDLNRNTSAWSVGSFPIETTSRKVSSWQSTPDNTHYPSEKLVKDSLDTKAEIGDILFANFSRLTPKKTFEYDVSDTAYHPLFSRANTGISQLMSEVDDIVKFRITVTGTNIYARVDVVVRFQPALTAPCMMAWNENNSNIAANSGIYYMRAAIPKAINSGHDWFVEFNVNNATTRHIKVEVYEDTENITWAETKTASSFNTTFQSDANGTIQLYTNRGLCANQSWNLQHSSVYTSVYAGYLSQLLSTWIAGTTPLAGEALAGNQLVVMSNQKIYKATNKNVPIDCDCGVSLQGSSVAADGNVGHIYIRQKQSWTTLTGDPALTHDTFARGDQVYLRCTLGQDGKIYPDGHLSNVKSAGYTWVHIGTAASATAINLDTCGKPFITLNNDGKVTHINGTAVMDSSMSKWGVVSQTQTWTQASDGGYDYTMKNLQYGWIPQANIDLYEAAGAVFNETSGYFELNGLVDISYEEMKGIYNRRMTQSPSSWAQMNQAALERTILPITTDTSYLAGGGAMTNFALSAHFETVVFHRKAGGVSAGIGSGTSFGNAFCLCKWLKSVQRIRAGSITGFLDSFKNCFSLENVELYELKVSIGFPNSPRLTVVSILYMINNEASTSAITITLHPTAYARAIADSDVQAALQAHTNVSLASAT